MKLYPLPKLFTEPLLPVKGSWIDAFPMIVILGLLLSAAWLLISYKGKKTEWFRTAIRTSSLIIFVFFLFKCLCVVKLAAFSITEIGKDDLVAFGFIWLLVIVGAITAIFGRIYCGWLCPINFMQDISHSISPIKRPKTRKAYITLLLLASLIFLYMTWPANEFAYEFIIAIFTFIMLSIMLIVQYRPELEKKLMKIKYVLLSIYLVTCVIGIYYSEVWCTLYGSEIDYSSVISLPLVILAAVAVGMPYCRYICPTGFFLALLSRHAFFRIRGNCRNCDKECSSVCQVGALSKGKIDPLLCVYCGRCIRNCGACMTTHCEEQERA